MDQASIGGAAHLGGRCAGARRDHHHRPGRRGLGHPLADLCGPQAGILRRQGHSARHRVHALQQRPGAAARRGLARCRAVDRHRGSDLCHRQGRRDRGAAPGDGVAALCPDGQALHPKHKGAQGQDRHGRWSQGHHAALCGADAGGQRPAAGRRRDLVRGRDLGALLGAVGRRDRRHHPAAAVQLLRRVRPASGPWASPSTTRPSCRSPARWSTGAGP